MLLVYNRIDYNTILRYDTANEKTILPSILILKTLLLSRSTVYRTPYVYVPDVASGILRRACTYVTLRLRIEWKCRTDCFLSP
jgi:hypothetical protein